MARQNKIDTRAIGLDIGLAFSKFLTGHENLHYGLWNPDLPVCAANVGEAQEAYTEKLFGLLPADKSLQILDIGGGAGETAHRDPECVSGGALPSKCRAGRDCSRKHV